MPEDKKPAGYYRLEFYRIFEEMVGRKITDPEHKFLKALLQNYLKDNEQAEVQRVQNEHVITCPSCLSVKSIFNNGKPYMKRVKAMTEFRTKGFVKSGARGNLLKMMEQYPAQAMNCLDAAYVAGLDDAKATESKS